MAQSRKPIGVIPLRVLVTGSRTWKDERAIRRALCTLPAGSTIAHGEAPRGADAIADTVAREFGYEVKPYPVKRELDGLWPAAGPRRNVRMLEDFKPTLVLAFRAEGKSNGTDHCVREAEKRGIPVSLFRV